MKVKYFSDTDTALVEFTGREVSETKEISENIYIDIDDMGNIVSPPQHLVSPLIFLNEDFRFYSGPFIW